MKKIQVDNNGKKYILFRTDIFFTKYCLAVEIDEKVDNNNKKYILFRTDIFFTKYCLTVEIDEKGHTDRDLIFEQKRQEALEKKLNCTFIRINTSK